jgi:hypothetical protein
LGNFGDEVQGAYSAGEVTGGTHENRGGFIGVDGSGTYAACYWDTTTAGANKGVGNIKGEVPGIHDVTDEQLKSGLPSGFDPSVWAEDPNINDGLPYLLANPPLNK